MKTIINPLPESWPALLQRPSNEQQNMSGLITEVFSEIRTKGDAAVRKYTQLFDGSSVDEVQVPENVIQNSTVSDPLKAAITLAKGNIERFHNAQKTAEVSVETTPGVHCWQEKRPIEKVGLYIPGGTAPLFSTILMLAIPAKIAGCSEIVLCTPPDSNGEIAQAILYTARLCGITKIFKVGGIQAIAAMTYGTASIPAVFKIFGPGNQYVTAAKQFATSQGIAIDMPAGPSELLVFADHSANASFVAADLLSQAEHGVDSQVLLVTTSIEMAKAVETEINKQLPLLARKEIASKAMANSKIIVVRNNDDAIDLINGYAPEHFILIAENESFFLERLQHAGSVFIGNYTPESAGDYASGTNHTLPTNGYAKQYSGVNLDSFLKSITFQKISRKGIRTIGPAIEIMAEAEGLQAHKNAVRLRLKALKNE